MSAEEKRPFFGTFGNSISFASREECLPDAPQLAWRPASIAYRNSQEEQERHFITLYLRWLFAHKEEAMCPPLTIRRAGGENEPDFAVVEGNFEYGIEVSRATTQRLQRSVNALIEAQSPSFIELDPALNVENDDEPFDPSWVINLVGTRPTGEGWIGLDPEVQWAAIMAYRIGEKVKKFADRYSKVFPTCDLLLYSDSHAPVVELESAIGFLKERLVASGEFVADAVLFRKVSIVCESWAVFDALGQGCKIATKEGWPFDR